MKICPECEAEFLEHVGECHTCKVVLVSKDDGQYQPKKDIKQAKKDLLNEEVVPILESNLASCREVETVLEKRNLLSIVYPVSLKSENQAATLGSSCAKKYVVLVRASEAQACHEVLQGQFESTVNMEGKGRFVSEAVDLSHNEVTCPACGETGALKEGECSVCGLFLGET